MVSAKVKKTTTPKANDRLVRFEDEEFDDNWGAKKPPIDTEKTRKLKSMFFFFLLDISWKLAVSFLIPFFIGLVLANGDTVKILAGMAVGFGLSVMTIIYEVKKINKAIKDV